MQDNARTPRHGALRHSFHDPSSIATQQRHAAVAYATHGSTRLTNPTHKVPRFISAPVNASDSAAARLLSTRHGQDVIRPGLMNKGSVTGGTVVATRTIHERTYGMDVTLAFLDEYAMEGFSEANVVHGHEVVSAEAAARTALGEVSQALVDGIHGLERIPTKVAESFEEAQQQADRALRIHFRHVDPSGAFLEGAALMIQRSENVYLIGVPHSDRDPRLVLVHAVVSESRRGWTVVKSSISRPPTE